METQENKRQEQPLSSEVLYELDEQQMASVQGTASEYKGRYINYDSIKASTGRSTTIVQYVKPSSERLRLPELRAKYADSN